jgi:hypothetical protein
VEKRPAVGTDANFCGIEVIAPVGHENPDQAREQAFFEFT